MVSVRQTLDRSSRNTIRDSNDIHRHHAQTIRRPSATTSGATSRHTAAILSATERATAYGLVLAHRAVVGLLGAGAQRLGVDR
jgi:hypothetical protein